MHIILKNISCLCIAEALLPFLQLEVFKLQSNNRLKDKHKKGKLTYFYKCLPGEGYSALKSFAQQLISAFGTTYLFEMTFFKDEAF